MRIAVGYTDGLIGKEIADRYGISYNTVVKHTQNIYGKTNIRHSTNALVAWFIATNYGIDLNELRRKVESMILLALIVINIASADNTYFSRRIRQKRTEIQRVSGRRRGDDDDNTYVL